MEKASSKKQFVVHEHKTTSGVHWDLMLEHKGELWTWRVEIYPSQIGDRPITTERIFDHPLRFLTYEGPVQNATASVAIVDKGSLCFHQINDQTIIFGLKGQILDGFFTLRLTKAPFWTLLKNSP